MQALGQALLRVQELEAETSDQGAELAELRDYQAKAEATAQTAFGQQMDSLKQASLPSLHEGPHLLHSLWPADRPAQPERCGASHAQTPFDWQTDAQAGWPGPALMLLRHLWVLPPDHLPSGVSPVWTSTVLRVSCGSHLLGHLPPPATGVSAAAHADPGRQPLLSPLAISSSSPAGNPRSVSCPYSALNGLRHIDACLPALQTCTLQ